MNCNCVFRSQELPLSTDQQLARTASDNINYGSLGKRLYTNKNNKDRYNQPVFGKRSKLLHDFVEAAQVHICLTMI